MDEDIIENIPKTMEKFFGCRGKMLRPSLMTVKEVIRKIRKGRLVTLDQLREKLARDFAVQTACPASTTKALQLIAQQPRPACYWRVIKKNGELMSKYPGGVEGHAALLKKEGFKIDSSGKKPLVVDYKAKLSRLT